MAMHRNPETRRRLTRRVIALAAALTAIATLSFAAPAAAAPSDFLGHWTSIDTDGSHQTLWIRGSGSHDPKSVAMVYRDDVASQACGGDAAQVAGTGRFDGDVLVMTGALTCKPGGNFLHFRINLDFAYDSGSDTLVDNAGIVWERA